jgi:hypothetical protein
MLDLGIGHRKTVLLIYATTIFVIMLSTSLQFEPSVVLVITAFIAVVFSQVPSLLLRLRRRRKLKKA